MKLAKINTKSNYASLNGRWLQVTEIVENRVSCLYFKEEFQKEITVDFTLDEVEVFDCGEGVIILLDTKVKNVWSTKYLFFKTITESTEDIIQLAVDEVKNVLIYDATESTITIAIDEKIMKRIHIQSTNLLNFLYSIFMKKFNSLSRKRYNTFNINRPIYPQNNRKIDVVWDDGKKCTLTFYTGDEQLFFKDDFVGYVIMWRYSKETWVTKFFKLISFH